MKPSIRLDRRWLLALLAVALAGALALVAARTGPLAATRVTTARVAAESLVPTLFGVGTVEARRSYGIGPTAAGRVASVAVDVGDTVAPGQLLAEIDPVDLDERLAALDASVARARSTIASLQAQRRDAEAKGEVAATNARRSVELAAMNFISPSAVEVRLQEKASADAALGAMDAGIEAARHDLRRIESEQAALRQQRARLRLVAPVAGLVVGRDAEPGSTVVAGQSVLRVIEPSSLWVRVRLDQARSAGLAPGLPARVVLRSAAHRPVDGRVARVEALSDSVTEERIAYVSFDEPPPGASVGELVEVTLSLTEIGDALVVPNASVRRRNGTVGVWRLGADGLQFAPVQLGATADDGRVQVLSGLQAGDEIVVHSAKDIGADSRIRVVPTLVADAP